MKSAAGENYNIVLPPGAQQPVLLQGWIQGAVAAALLKRAGYDYETLKRAGADRRRSGRSTCKASFSADSRSSLRGSPAAT